MSKAKIQNDNKNISYLTDALTGVLKNDYDDKAVREERLTKRFTEKTKV